MHIKTTVILVLLAGLSYPAQSFGYGEGDDITYGERAMHILVNDARSDPLDALKGCANSSCKEGMGCFSHTSYPVWWRHDLRHAAEVQTKLLFEAGGDLNAHYTPCKLKTDIASLYPTKCNGAASCACQEGKVTPNAHLTSFSDRIKLFDKYPETAGENAAGVTDAWDSMYAPYRMFYMYLYEVGDVTTCKSTPANGHRWTICEKDSPLTYSAHP